MGAFGEQPVCASHDTNPNSSLFEERLCQLCAPRLSGQLWGLKTAPRPHSQEDQAPGHVDGAEVVMLALGDGCKYELPLTK